jgi:hypothetical protein
MNRIGRLVPGQAKAVLKHAQSIRFVSCNPVVPALRGRRIGRFAGGG